MEIRVFSHATEDQLKVETAVQNLLPQELAAETKFTNTACTGHHGNPIVLLEATLENRQMLPKVLEKIGAMLSSLDKEQLATEFKEHLEKRSLFLRFDKQSAFLGNAKFSSNDPIRVKIHFKNKTFEEIAELCKQAGLLP
jgi:RNA binding exosome subunit